MAGCLLCATDNLFDREEITLLSTVSSAEGAKAAALHADVGEVDVPVDDVGHRIAHTLAADMVGSFEEALQVAALCGEQEFRIGCAQFEPGQRAVEDDVDVHHCSH